MPTKKVSNKTLITNKIVQPMSNNLLAGKRGIIFGALDEQSIAWKTAEKCVEQGAKITLTNAPVALRFGTINELGKKLNAEIIGGSPSFTCSFFSQNEFPAWSLRRAVNSSSFIFELLR